MPISLTHINLSTRGFTPRRPDAEMGTVCVETGSPGRGRPPEETLLALAGSEAPRRASQPPRSATRVTSSLTSFTDWRWCTGRHKNCVALRPPRGLSNHHPLLASYDFQGSRGLKQKRKLSPGPDASGRKPDPVTRARHTFDPALPVRERARPVRTQVTELLPCSLSPLHPFHANFRSYYCLGGRRDSHPVSPNPPFAITIFRH